MRNLIMVVFWVCCIIYSKGLNAQCVPCDVGTASFSIDFSSNPDTTYALSSTRSGHCCGATGSTQCIKFEIDVHPQTTEIGFSVANPSPPGGAFYQVNCGPPTSLGTPLCVTGMSSFCISFCKSGGDSPTYTISASRSFAASPDVAINSNCATDISVTGLDESSITWTSIFPGAAGAYDGYLSCVAGCDTTTVTPQPGYPPYIDYMVSGTPVGCAVGVSSDTVRVYITPGIIPTITPNPALVCFGSSDATVAASGTGGAPPYSYIWNTGDTTQAIAVGAGTYWVGITDTTIGCPPVYDTVVVASSVGPITANAGIDQTVCSTAPVVTLAGVITEATGGIWTGGTGVFSPNDTTLNATYTPSAAEITAGTVTLTLSTTGNGGCTPDSDQMTITIQAAPVVNAGADQALCEGSTLALAGSVVGGAGTGIWTTSGSGTFSPSNTDFNAIYTPSAADVAAGTVNITLTSTASCATVSDFMVLTLTPQIVVVAGVDQVICSGSTASLSGSVTGGSTSGQWTSSGTGTFTPSNTALNAVYTPSAADITAGNVTLTLSSTNNGGCGVQTDQMTITIQAAPVVNAGADQALCEGSTLALAGSVVGGAGTGIWTTSGSGTFSPSNTDFNAIYTPSAADVAAGTVNITLTSTASCATVSDFMVLTLTPQIVVISGVDQIICTGATATLNGSVTGGSTTGQWTSSGTGTFTPSNTALNAVYTPSAADITAGTLTLTLSSTNNGGCGVQTDQMTISIQAPPVVGADTNQIICTGSTATLNGSVTGGTTTGIWTTSGSGTFSSNTDLNAVYTPSAADVATGTVTLTLTSTGGCLTVSDQMTITITPAPVVNAGPDQTVCANNPVASLAGSVTVGSTTGIWTTSGSGTFSSNTDLNATYTPSAADTAAGTVTLTLTSTNGCLAIADDVVITISSAPVVIAGADITMCANNVVTLNGSVTGLTTTGIWTTSGSGTFSSNTDLNATYTPSNADTTIGTVTLTLTSTNNGSCLAVADILVVTFSPAPGVNAGPDQTVCGNNAVVSLSGTVSGGSTTGIWTTSGSGTFAPSNTDLNASYTPSTADSSAGAVTLTLTSTNNGTCLPVADQMTITITPSPLVNAGADVTVCESAPNVSLSGSVTGGTTTGQWSSSGTGTFTPSNTALNAVYTPSAADIASGIFTLTLVSTNNGSCIQELDSMVVTITPALILNAGADVTMCANNVINLGGSVTGFSNTGQWSSSGTGTFTPSNTNLNATYTPSTADTTVGSVVLTLTSTNNGSCAPETDQMTITFTSAPGVDAGIDTVVCANNPIINLNGSVSSSFNGQWTSSGTGTFSPSASVLNPTYTFSAADTVAGVVNFVLEATNLGNCLPVYDTVVISVISSPIVNAGVDTFVCVGLTANLNGSVINGSGTGQWTTLGTGAFSSNTDLNAIYTPSAADYSAGSVVLVLTSTNNGSCLADADSVTITFTAPPTVNAGPDVSICDNTFAQLAGSVSGTSTTGQWITLGDGTFSPSNTDLNAQYTPGPNDITNGTVTLTLESTLSCLATDILVITLIPGPQADAGTDQTICITDNQVVLSGAVTGNTTTGQWSSLGTGTFTPNNTDLNATYNLTSADSAAGSFVLILTSTNNGTCSADIDTMLVTLTTIPAVNAGIDTTFCANNMAALNGNISGGASTGIWTTSGTGTFSPVDTDLNAIYVPSAADINVGFVTLTLNSTGACVVVSDDMVLTITPAPVVFAGIDTSICDSSDLQLNGTVSGGSSTVLWTTSGDGTFAPSNTDLNAVYSPGVTDLSNGSFDLFIESTNNGDCNAVRDTLSVLILSSPAADAGLDQLVCGGSNVSLSGVVTGASVGLWSTLGTGTFINASSLTTSYIPSNADTAAGSVEIILASDPLYGCGQVFDTLVVTFVGQPQVDAGIDFSVCANNDTIALSGTSSNGNGLWTTAGDGIWIPSDSLLNAIYVPGNQDSINGQVAFALTPLNAQNCPAVFDTVVVTITPPPSVDAGADIAACLNNPLVSLNGSVSGGASTGVWTTNGSGTFAPSNTVLNATYTPSNADTAAGTIWLVLTSTNNGNCLAEDDTTVVTFESAPMASAGLDVTVCQIDTAFLQATLSGGGAIFWETTNGLGTFAPDSISNPTGYIPVAADTAAPVEVIMTYTNACASVTDTVLITVLPAPGLSMAYTINCETFEVQFNAITTGGTIQSVNWDFGDSNTDTTVTPQHTYATPGSYNVSLTVITADGCADSVTQNVVIEPLPVADFDVSDSIVFVNEVIVFNDTSTTAAAWEWNFGDLTGPYFVEDTTYYYGTPGTYVVTLVVYNGSGCADSTSRLIIVNPYDGDDDEIVVNPPAVPTAFTPNGDYKNDILFVRGGPFEAFDFRVYNEWGNEVFRSTDPLEGWDGNYKGNEQPVGIYIYLFEGTTVDGEKYSLSKDFSLIR